MSDKSSLDANKGSVGKEFTPQGKAGGTAQEIGMRTPLDFPTRSHPGNVFDRG